MQWLRTRAARMRRNILSSKTNGWYGASNGLVSQVGPLCQARSQIRAGRCYSCPATVSQSERDGTSADFLLLLLPSGIRTAHLGALIAAYYCTGLDSVPYLICKCGVLQGCWLISARAQRWSVYALSGLRACVAIVEIGSRFDALSPCDDRQATINPST